MSYRTVVAIEIERGGLVQRGCFSLNGEDLLEVKGLEELAARAGIVAADVGMKFAESYRPQLEHDKKERSR